MDKRELQALLDVMVKDKNAFLKLKSDFPDTLADLTTYRNNPNCSCRGRVLKYFGQKIKEDANVLQPYLTPDIIAKAKVHKKTLPEPAPETEEQSVADQQAAIQEMRNDPNNNYAGKVFYVDKSPEAWGQFVASLNGKFFKSFSVAERDSVVAVYFL